MKMCSRHSSLFLKLKTRGQNLTCGAVLFAFGTSLAQAADDACANFFRQFGTSSSPSSITAAAKQLSKVELDQIKNQRVCIESFPWESKAHDAFFSSGKKGWTLSLSSSLRDSVHAAVEKYQGSALVRDFQQHKEVERKYLHLVAQGVIPYSKIRSEICEGAQKLWAQVKDASKVEQQVALLLSLGGEPEQVRLYSDFLYCSSALKEGKSDLVIACVAQAKKRAGIEIPRSVLADQAEQATYFSQQALINMLSNVEYSALSSKKTTDPNAALELVSRFLDDLPAIEPHFGISGDPTDTVLDTISDEMIRGFGLNAPAWQRMQTLKKHPDLLGFIRDEEGVTLYVGKNKAHTIRFDGVGWKILPDAEAQKLFTDHCRSKIAQASKDKMHLFCTYPVSDGRLVHFPDGTDLKLSAQEEETLRLGTQLPPEHALSKKLNDGKNHVLFSTPLMEKDGGPLRDADSFTFALQRAYPKAKMLRDPLSAQTALLTEKVATFSVSRPTDLMVIVPDPKLGVPQGKIIANIAADLKAAKVGVSVISGSEKYSGKSGKAVFVITGHSSEELAGFVRQLGDGGFLKNNYVIFNSCETDLTRELLTEINGRYGAIGTYAFEGKIMAASVQEYLLDLVKELNGKTKLNLMELLSRMVQKQKLTGVFTVCRND